MRAYHASWISDAIYRDQQETQASPAGEINGDDVTAAAMARLCDEAYAHSISLSGSYGSIGAGRGTIVVLQAGGTTYAAIPDNGDDDATCSPDAETKERWQSWLDTGVQFVTPADLIRIAREANGDGEVDGEDCETVSAWDGNNHRQIEPRYTLREAQRAGGARDAQKSVTFTWGTYGSGTYPDDVTPNPGWEILLSYWDNDGWQQNPQLVADSPDDTDAAAALLERVLGGIEYEVFDASGGNDSSDSLVYFIATVKTEDVEEVLRRMNQDHYLALLRDEEDLDEATAWLSENGGPEAIPALREVLREKDCEDDGPELDCESEAASRSVIAAIEKRAADA